MPNPNDEYFQELILNGVIEPAAIDSATGEILYSFTESALEAVPNLKNQLDEEFHSFIMFFWEKGFITMNPMLDSPVVNITEKALDSSEVEKLPFEYQAVLKIILEALRIQ
jgi:hypothetical protein